MELSLEGRAEPRISLPVLVYLSDPERSEASELAVTENVSGRGVRVVTKRRCEPGRELYLAPLVNHKRLRAEIVYCQMISFNSFWVGLKIRQDCREWWKGS